MENGTIRWLRGLSEPKLPYDFGCFATGPYPTGVSISQKAMHQLCLVRSKFHGDWNYVLKPKVAK